MTERPKPEFRAHEGVTLVGMMAIYDSQDDATERIQQQWRAFRRAHPKLGDSGDYYGASPCSSDGKLHYLTGVAQRGTESAGDGERLTLEAGEYATVIVRDAALLRDTWIRLLREWLPNSGRREKNAPEFERFAGISEAGTPVGPVEIWIPLEPLPE
jgi:AraC family transcriptional regulator